MADKVTMAEFEKRLSDGRYDSIAGARRGVGKMSGWDEKERALAHKKVNAHFGEGASAPAPKKAAKAPKVKAAVKREPKVAAKAPKVKATRAKRGTAQVAAVRQLDLPLDGEISKVQASQERSKALESILKNALATKDLGGPDADIRRVAALASKELIESIRALLGAHESTKQQPQEEGNGSDQKVDTSVADAALMAAAEAAKKVVARGPMAIPPMMGRQS